MALDFPGSNPKAGDKTFTKIFRESMNEEIQSKLGFKGFGHQKSLFYWFFLSAAELKNKGARETSWVKRKNNRVFSAVFCWILYSHPEGKIRDLFQIYG